MLDKLGGAGTCATMGARVFYPQNNLNIRERPVGFIVHAGNDFPPSVRAELESWNTNSVVVETPNRCTTRGKNVYQNEVRGS